MDAVWSDGSAGSKDEAIRRYWRLPREKVYKTRITDLDDLKHRIITEWATLDQAVIAAAVASVASTSFSLCESGWWSFRALLLILTFEQLSVDIPV